MASSSEPLGLVAGSTQMPRAVAEEARRGGHRVLALAIREITDPRIDDVADDVRWLEWGDLSGLMQAVSGWREAGVDHAVMAGKVEQRRIYDDPGGGALEALLDGLPDRHTDRLIGAVADLLSSHGIELRPCTDFLGPYLASEGMATRRSPDDRERADIDHGWNVAKALGRLDIGQTLAVRDRAVVAVEAMEGTDACIRRAGELAGSGCVVVKVAKPEQDLRFDLPTVGRGTIEAMVAAGCTALALEAGTTVVLDGDDMLSLADEHDVAVVVRRS